MSRQYNELMASVARVLPTSEEIEARFPQLTQVLIDGPKDLREKFDSALERAVREALIPSTDGIILPPDGRIHVVSVPVNESREWSKAVKAAGPNTGSDRDIWKVGGEYPPNAGATEDLREVILVNFGENTRSEDNLAWGKAQNLRPATPRLVFAVGEHRPKLHRELDMDPMAVVSLVPCSFGGYRRVPLVWWYRSERITDLHWFDRDWGAIYWFAFVRE